MLQSFTLTGDTDLESGALATVADGDVTFLENNMLWNNKLTCFATFSGDYAYTIDKSFTLNAYGASMDDNTFMDGYTNNAVMTCVVWTDLEPKSVAWTRVADNQPGDQEITGTYNSRVS